MSIAQDSLRSSSLSPPDIIMFEGGTEELSVAMARLRDDQIGEFVNSLISLSLSKEVL